MDYSIHQVAERMGLTPHTLRYYEREGLLPQVRRSEGGVRRFSDDDLEWLSLILCLKGTGMPIKQIGEFVQLSQQGGSTLRQRCRMLREHRKSVEEQIRTLEAHLKKVCAKIEHYDRKLRQAEETEG